MTVRKVREWVNSIDPEDADEQTFTDLENTLSEVEMTVNDLDDTLLGLESVETYPDHVSRRDEKTIISSWQELEELHHRYSELLEDVREKFQAVDEQLYGEA